MNATNLFSMKLLLPLLLFLLNSAVYAQNRNTSKSEKMLGSWYMYHGNHQLSSHLHLITGFQLRTYEAVENHNLSFGYLGAAYQLSKSISLGVKYGYMEIDRSIEFLDQPNAIEHRIMEHFLYKLVYLEHRFLQRIQLEHRFIHFLEDNTVQHRLRYRLGYQYPFFKRFTLELSNEFFFHTDKKSYRENRFYTGLTIKASQNTKFKMGYMKHYINSNLLDRLQIGIVLNTGFK